MHPLCLEAWENNYFLKQKLPHFRRSFIVQCIYSLHLCAKVLFHFRTFILNYFYTFSPFPVAGVGVGNEVK